MTKTAVRDFDENSAYSVARTFRTVKIAGKDAFSFLQGLTTQDVKTAERAERARILFPNSKGKVVFDAYLRKEKEEAYRLHLLPEFYPVAQQYFDFFHVMEDVEILPLEAETALRFRFSNAAGKNGESAPLYVSPERRLTVSLEENSPSPEREIALAGEEDYDALRALFSMVEIRDAPHSYPAELGLLDCVSFSKGCYVGQEPIARMQFKAKAAKSLYALRSPERLEKGTWILTDGRKAGSTLLCSSFRRNGQFHLLASLKTRIFGASDRPDLRVDNIPLSLV